MLDATDKDPALPCLGHFGALFCLDQFGCLCQDTGSMFDQFKQKAGLGWDVVMDDDIQLMYTHVTL